MLDLKKHKSNSVRGWQLQCCPNCQGSSAYASEHKAQEMILVTPSFSSERSWLEGPIEPCRDHLEATGGMGVVSACSIRLRPGWSATSTMPSACPTSGTHWHAWPCRRRAVLMCMGLLYFFREWLWLKQWNSWEGGDATKIQDGRKDPQRQVEKGLQQRDPNYPKPFPQSI